MKSLILALVLLFPITSFGQGFNLDDFVPVAEEVASPVEPINIDNVNFDKESRERLEEMRKLAEEVKRIADEIKYSNSSENPSSLTSLEDRVTNLENKSLNYVTKEDVTTIVKEEVKKYVDITMKVGDKLIEKRIPLVATENAIRYNSVTVPGYSGAFEIPEGGYVTSIDGVPVQPSIITGNVITNYSNGHVIQGQDRQFKIASPSNCRFVNGRMQCN